jgi:2'-5' RNA ligase
MRVVRVFVAVDINDEKIKHYAMKIQDLIRSSGIKATYPNPDQLHITLKFIGEVDESIIPRIIESLSKIEHPPLTLSFNGVGGFPSLNRPRVIFVDVEEDEGIEKLYWKVERSLSFLGRREERRFHPHLTVARIKSTRRWNEKLSGALKSLSFSQKIKVDNFMLKKSVLKPYGPEYSNIHVFRLEQH